MYDVIKIGGSVLSNVDDLDFAARKIAKFSSGNLPIIVISAFKNYTDDLVKMNSYFCDKQSSFVTTVGEQITAGLFELALQKYGKKAKALAGWQIPLIVSSRYEDGLFLDERKIRGLLEDGVIPIITGFQGVDESFEIRDLGRGGSDLSAIFLAKVFKSTCILLKHSGGICSADPNLVDEFFIWSDIGYDNLLSLAQSGSKVVQKEALVVAKASKVPIKITNLDFASHTYVRGFNENFWSLLAYQEKLRIVTNKIVNSMSDHGFCFFGNYYERNDNNLNRAREVYSLCKRYF